MKLILFSLALVFAICACSHPRPDYARFKSVASIDQQQTSHVDALLRRRGIVSFIEGSVVYGVFVAPEDREHTLQILREDSQREHYQVWY